jgi:hypothetical protein
MPGKNEVTLTFAGDATQLTKSFTKVADDSKQMSTQVEKSSGNITKGFDKVNFAAGFVVSEIGDLAGSVGALTHLSRENAERSDQMARAQLDVQQALGDVQQALQDATQAQDDYNQAQQDGRQAARDAAQAQIDVEQANLDVSTAQEELTKAVREHGKDSHEARQATIDLKQAQEDLSQAQEDGKQATLDIVQANTDASQAHLDLSQAQRDTKDGQLAINEARRNAVPPNDLDVWADRLAKLSPLLFAATLGSQLWTGAQWLLNVAMDANPVGAIIVAVVALIAVIVLIATKTTWFETAWKVSWGWIKRTAEDVWHWLEALPGNIGRAFSSMASTISSPFRSAFNFVADAWNNTIGKLSWTVPGWVPVIGGNTIAAPRLPKFHTGGVVPGVPGSEMLAVLQAGERVTPAGQDSGNARSVTVRFAGNTDSALAAAFIKLVRDNVIRINDSTGAPAAVY